MDDLNYIDGKGLPTHKGKCYLDFGPRVSTKQNANRAAQAAHRRAKAKAARQARKNNR